MTEQYCFLSCRLSVGIYIDIEIFIWFCLYVKYVVKCYFSTTFRTLLNNPEEGTHCHQRLLQQSYLLSPLCRLLSQPRRALQHLKVILRSGNFFTLSFIFCLWVLRWPGTSAAGNSQWLFFPHLLFLSLLRFVWRGVAEALLSGRCGFAPCCFPQVVALVVKMKSASLRGVGT